jgi:pectate lyase
MVFLRYLALIPGALACLGWEGGIPVATSTKTNSKVIEVAAGQTFDGGWARYDRGSGACNDQAEGGKCATSLPGTKISPELRR